jgi:hypothetical protein
MLTNVQYSVIHLDPVPGKTTIAFTAGFKTELNANAFFDPTLVPGVNADGTPTTKNLLLTMANNYGLDYSKLSVSDFQTIILLHELGHSLGVLPDDADSGNQSGKNTQTVVDKCFQDVKR